MHQEDGSPLSLGQQLCGREQSAILCPLHRECVWYCCLFFYNIFMEELLTFFCHSFRANMIMKWVISTLTSVCDYLISSVSPKQLFVYIVIFGRYYFDSCKKRNSADKLMYCISWQKQMFIVNVTNKKILNSFFIIVRFPFILCIALLSLISDLYSDKRFRHHKVSAWQKHFTLKVLNF